MATPTPDTYLGRRFAEFTDTWDAGWPAAARGGLAADHADAMACRDLEQRVAYALHLYQLATDEADRVGRNMERTGTVYDLPGAKYVESLLTAWVEPAVKAVKQVDAMEAKGYVVERSAEFRAAVLDARVSISIPVERAAAQAERIAREGLGRNAKTTEELRHELRRRLGA